MRLLSRLDRDSPAASGRVLNARGARQFGAKLRLDWPELLEGRHGGHEPAEAGGAARIVARGGTGLIGSQVVKIHNASGHEAVRHSPSTGVDLLTGRGLPGALQGAGVVVNLTNSPTFDDASPAFFQTTMDSLLAAASAVGVGHAVLSIVGACLSKTPNGTRSPARSPP